MNEKEIKRKSKFLSLVLRHRPEFIGIKLDENGWVMVDELLQKTKLKGINISSAELYEIVDKNNKKRFAFNEDGTKIRANQGHSVKTIDLGLEAVQPPEELFHGTVEKFLGSIQSQGLQKMKRQHVHLSKDLETAINVGSRRGKAIILKVKAEAMHKAGFEFYISDNGVWLTDEVPSQYIIFE